MKWFNRAGASQHASADRPWTLITPRDLFASPNGRDWEGRCRQMAVAINVGDDTLLCRTLSRFKMYVSTQDAGLAPHLAADGYWEIWNTRVMTQAIEPGMICIDAGANIGYFTVLMADLAGPDGRVIAAEPVPETRRFLQKNIAINGYDGMTEVLPAAFGAQKGEVSLYIPPGEPKNALICDLPPAPHWECVKAEVKPIDDLDLPRVDFVKIDVEGAEMLVWQGMQKTIDRSPRMTIMMEVNCARYRAEAAAFLKDIEARFPLRFVDFSGAHRPTTAEEVIDYPDDVMLYLQRG
jgi:FkbM family methyltransferase